jgi:hypothetical protein
MTYERQCEMLAGLFLQDYQLSPEERAEEKERLAIALQRTAEAELENLAHRLKT